MSGAEAGASCRGLFGKLENLKCPMSIYTVPDATYYR